MGEGQPPSWTTYVSVDDADKTAARVTEAGGQVLVEPMDVMAAGRMAVFMDPTGAAFSIWQPGETIGAQLVNEPGTLCWNELATRDAEAAKTFYSHVFDWTWQPMAVDGPEYWMIEVGGRVSGGLMPMVGDMWPADLPSHWMTYFAVDDADASAARVTELGGSRDGAADRHPAGTVRGRQRSPRRGLLDPQAQPGRPGSLSSASSGAPITWRRGTRDRGRGAGLIAARSRRVASVRRTSRAPIAPADHEW